MEVITADELWTKYGIQLVPRITDSDNPQWEAYRVGAEVHFYYIHRLGRFDTSERDKTWFPSELLLRMALTVLFNLHGLRDFDAVYVHMNREIKRENEKGH